MKGLSTIPGFPDAFRRFGFRAVAGRHLRWLPGRRPTGPTNCSSGAAPSSWWCRPPSQTRCVRAAFFVDRLSGEGMPLAGLILNPHPSDAVLALTVGARRSTTPRNWTGSDPRLTDGGGAAGPRRPGADRQTGDPTAVAIHRGQPARTDRRGAVVAVRCLRHGGAAGDRRSDHPDRLPRAGRSESSVSADGAMFALSGEELGPGNHLGCCLSRPALTLVMPPQTPNSTRLSGRRRHSAMTGQCRQMTAALRWAAPARRVRRDRSPAAAFDTQVIRASASMV